MKLLKNQQGFITADFMFAIVLIFGLTAVLFAMTFTMTVASITQYITFAAARNYAAGNATEVKQKALALSKYQQLVGDKVFSPLYKNKWFVIGKTPDIGDVSASAMPGYKASGDDPNLFWGVGTYFTASILDFNIPIFGGTDPDGSGDGANFKTYMGSYLGREVATDECVAFVGQRWTNITKLSVSGGAAYSTAQGTFIPFTDDGC